MSDARKKERFCTFRPKDFLADGLVAAKAMFGTTASAYIEEALLDRMRSDGLLRYAGGRFAPTPQALRFLRSRSSEPSQGELA